MPDAELLKGKYIAVTGRLASMSRTEVAELIRAYGGFFTPTVTRHTTFLVVGQDGWPLQKDGRLTGKLRKARLMQRAGTTIDVLTEEELLNRLGIEARTEDVRRLYSTAQLSGLLKIPGATLRRWVKAGLLRPVKNVDGISHFDYGQVVSAKTLGQLILEGVKPERLRRSMRQLRSWFGSTDAPLIQLAVLESNGDLLIRRDDSLLEPSGQGCLDFGESVDEPIVSLSQPPATADQWFEIGCDLEDGGRLEEAVHAYRQALLVGGPNSVICFNLANLLYRLQRKEQAAERYYQAVELDRGFAEAWNNLGIVLGDLGRQKEAVDAFEQALSQSPEYADAHFNLADLLEQLGDGRGAHAHWQSYLAQDQQSAWGKHAKKRLATSGG